MTNHFILYCHMGASFQSYGWRSVFFVTINPPSFTIKLHRLHRKIVTTYSFQIFLNFQLAPIYFSCTWVNYSLTWCCCMECCTGLVEHDEFCELLQDVEHCGPRLALHIRLPRLLSGTHWLTFLSSRTVVDVFDRWLYRINFIVLLGLFSSS